MEILRSHAKRTAAAAAAAAAPMQLAAYSSHPAVALEPADDSQSHQPQQLLQQSTQQAAQQLQQVPQQLQQVPQQLLQQQLAQQQPQQLQLSESASELAIVEEGLEALEQQITAAALRSVLATVTSLYHNCFGQHCFVYQENCPCLELSSPRGITAVRTRALVPA